MRSIRSIVLIGICLSACTSPSTTALTEEEKHRLYTAALAASESPLESENFKEVCRRIGIFDAYDHPNDNYMEFVKVHVEWAMRKETEPFKREINTREKAREYLRKFALWSRDKDQPSRP